MKKEYKKPQSRTYQFALPLMDFIGWGGSVPDGEANEAKRQTRIIIDDEEEDEWEDY